MKDVTLNTQIRALYPAFTNYARRLTGSEQTAPDLVQEAITRALYMAEARPQDQSLQSWVEDIMQRVQALANKKPQMVNLREVPRDMPIDKQREIDPDFLMDFLAVRSRVPEHLWNALASYMDHETYELAAFRTGKSPTHVRRNSNKARILLADGLGVTHRLGPNGTVVRPFKKWQKVKSAYKAES